MGNNKEFWSYTVFKDVVAANTAKNQLGNNLRKVVLAGTVTYTTFLPPASFLDLSGQIKRALEANGFSVINVRLNTDGLDAIFDIEIELNVYSQYTAEQARVNAIGVIESIKRSYLVTTVKVFYNTTLVVTYDANANSQTVPVGTTTTGSGSTQYNPSDYYPTNFPAISGSTFGSSFATALGISTPVALVGGGLLLILLMKR